MPKVKLTDDDTEFLKKNSEEDVNELIEIENNEEEDLKKFMCCRCGHRKVGSKGGRCSVCMGKLNRARHTPGTHQRAHYVADAALRRQKGKNGTASKKNTGLGSRKSIVKQTQRAEKKTGQELSPDRKDNGKGYAAKNTRMVPKSLNRGRHHVDTKKLAEWRKKLKKAYEMGILEDVLLKATMLAFQAGDIDKEQLEVEMYMITHATNDDLYKAVVANLDQLEELAKTQ